MASAAGDSLCGMSAAALAGAIARREVSPVEAMSATLERIDAVDPATGAYCAVAAERALDSARDAERVLCAGGRRVGPLHGVPFSVKDTLLTRAVRTTFGSRMDAAGTVDEDAPAVARMRAAGAILVGKTNTPEYGLLGVTENSRFGATHNPVAPGRTPGGSSGGAAAAVAAGLCQVALGSDSGGSLRIPAAFCGVAGFKATAGRVPVHPGSYSSVLAHVGPIARTVEDVRLVLDVIAGPDRRDPHSLPPVPPPTGTPPAPSALRIAWSEDLGRVPVESEVREACRDAVRRLEREGAEVEPVAVRWPPWLETWESLFVGGAAARLGPEERMGMDHRLASMLEGVDAWGSDRHARASIDRLAFAAEAAALFEVYDILLSPAVAVAPFELGSWGPDEIDGTVVPRPYGWMALSLPFNLSGQPAAAVPCGVTAGGLPVALQVVGRRFEEAAVLAFAELIELTSTDQLPGRGLI